MVSNQTHVNIPNCIFISAPLPLVWKYASIVLDQSEEEGAKIFMRQMTDSGDNEEDTHHENIVKFLNNYPKANLLYLEYIVLEKQIQVKISFKITVSAKNLTRFYAA